MKIKPVACLLMALFLAACDRPVAETADSVRPVKIFTVEDGGQQGVRYFPARLKAGDETVLSFKRGGHLQQLLVREGEQVKKGQLLAELDGTDLALRVRDRESIHQLAKVQYQRLTALAQKHFVSKAELDIKKAQLDSAAAALKIAREELGFTRITAPFDGVIANVNVSNYQIMSPALPVATLSSLDSLDVVFNVPERLFSALEIGNRSYQPLVRLNHMPGLEFPAVYKEHTTRTDAGSMTYRVTLTMQRPPDLPMLSGMSGSVKINFDNLTGIQPQSIVVPVEAVFNPDNTQRNQARVWVIKDENNQLHVEERKVQAGQLTANGIEIREGLASGERIVAAGTGELNDKQTVRPWVRERGL